MARTELSAERRYYYKETHIGQILIFCEGITEKHYFDYFAEIIEKDKFTDIKVETEDAKGNAQTVLNYANSFMEERQNNQKFKDYGKYLAFDCDSPKNIQDVIIEVKNKGFNLLLTNRLFETWLLMHFEEVNDTIGKRQTYKNLEEHLHNNEYKKGQKGKIREIVQTGKIEKAIENAERLQTKYDEAKLCIYSSIAKMNPYTNVHELIKQFMIAISKNNH